MGVLGSSKPPHTAGPCTTCGVAGFYSAFREMLLYLHRMLIQCRDRKEFRLSLIQTTVTFRTNTKYPSDRQNSTAW